MIDLCQSTGEIWFCLSQQLSVAISILEVIFWPHFLFSMQGYLSGLDFCRCYAYCHRLFEFICTSKSPVESVRMVFLWNHLMPLALRIYNIWLTKVRQRRNKQFKQANSHSKIEVVFRNLLTGKNLGPDEFITIFSQTFKELMVFFMLCPYSTIPLSLKLKLPLSCYNWYYHGISFLSFLLFQYYPFLYVIYRPDVVDSLLSLTLIMVI